MCWVGSKTVRRTPTPSASSRNPIGSSNHGSTTMSARHEPPDSSRELGTLEIECIVQEKIGKNRANHTTLRGTASSLDRHSIFHHRGCQPSFDVEQRPLALHVLSNCL